MTMERRYAVYEKQRNGFVTPKQLRRIHKKMNQQWKRSGSALHV